MAPTSAAPQQQRISSSFFASPTRPSFVLSSLPYIPRFSETNDFFLRALPGVSRLGPSFFLSTIFLTVTFRCSSQPISALTLVFSSFMPITIYIPYEKTRKKKHFDVCTSYFWQYRLTPLSVIPKKLSSHNVKQTNTDPVST